MMAQRGIVRSGYDDPLAAGVVLRGGYGPLRGSRNWGGVLNVRCAGVSPGRRGNVPDGHCPTPCTHGGGWWYSAAWRQSSNNGFMGKGR